MEKRCFQPVAVFSLSVMRQSNCSDPILPGCAGVMGKISVIEKGGALEKTVTKVIE